MNILGYVYRPLFKLFFLNGVMLNDPVNILHPRQQITLSHLLFLA